MKIFSETRAATLEDVSWLRRAIRRELTNLRIQPELVNDVQVAIAELATNAVVHGSPAPTQIGLDVTIHGATLRIEISDNGGPFDGFGNTMDAASKKLAIATGTSGLGLTLAAATLHNIGYQPGTNGEPNRMVGWRPLVRIRPGILLVGRDTDLQNRITAEFNDRYRVLGANSVGMAMAMVSMYNVDLIIADQAFTRPGPDDLVAELSRDAERLPIPIVMLAEAPAAGERGTSPASVERTLTKPVDLAKLRSVLADTLALNSRRLADVFRYCCVSVEQLVRPPTDDELAPLGAIFRSFKATAGGGDFVLHLSNENRERLVLADIVGHDLKAKAAAIAQATLIRTVHGTLSPERDPGYYLWTISRLMHDDPTLSELLLTMIVVDRLADGTIQIASAGHPAPILITGNKAETIDVGGPLLGINNRPDYTVARLKLGRRQRLVLVTDGVEPFTAAGGNGLPKGLVDCIKGYAKAPLAEAMSGAEKWALETHGPSPMDDWTIMLIENP